MKKVLFLSVALAGVSLWGSEEAASGGLSFDRFDIPRDLVVVGDESQKPSVRLHDCGDEVLLQIHKEGYFKVIYANGIILGLGLEAQMCQCEVFKKRLSETNTTFWSRYGETPESRELEHLYNAFLKDHKIKQGLAGEKFEYDAFIGQIQLGFLSWPHRFFMSLWYKLEKEGLLECDGFREQKSYFERVFSENLRLACATTVFQKAYAFFCGKTISPALQILVDRILCDHEKYKKNITSQTRLLFVSVAVAMKELVADDACPSHQLKEWVYGKALALAELYKGSVGNCFYELASGYFSSQDARLSDLHAARRSWMLDLPSVLESSDKGDLGVFVAHGGLVKALEREASIEGKKDFARLCARVACSLPEDDALRGLIATFFDCHPAEILSAFKEQMEILKEESSEDSLMPGAGEKK